VRGGASHRRPSVGEVSLKMGDKEGTNRLSDFNGRSHAAQARSNAQPRPSPASSPGHPKSANPAPDHSGSALNEQRPSVSLSWSSPPHLGAASEIGETAPTGGIRTGAGALLQLAHITAAIRARISSGARRLVAGDLELLPVVEARERLSKCQKTVSIPEIRRQAGEDADEFLQRSGSHLALRVIAAAAILVAGVAFVYWALSSNQYAAESKLLFFCQDSQNTGGVTLERELELLRDFDFVKTLARDMHIVPPEGTSDRRGDSRTGDAFAGRKVESARTDQECWCAGWARRVDHS